MSKRHTSARTGGDAESSRSATSKLPQTPSDFGWTNVGSDDVRTRVPVWSRPPLLLRNQTLPDLHETLRNQALQHVGSSLPVMMTLLLLNMQTLRVLDRCEDHFSALGGFAISPLYEVSPKGSTYLLKASCSTQSGTAAWIVFLVTVLFGAMAIPTGWLEGIVSNDTTHKAWQKWSYCRGVSTPVSTMSCRKVIGQRFHYFVELYIVRQ